MSKMPLDFYPNKESFYKADARMGSSRRGKFRRHLSNQFGRPKRNNRFSHFYNKVYIPSNWSVSLKTLLNAFLLKDTNSKYISID